MRLFTPFRLMMLIALLTAVLLAACDSRPTEYHIEVTRETTVVLVVTATSEGNPPPAPTLPDPTVTMTNAPSATPAPSTTPTITPTTDPFPTPVNEQIVVAERLFERGRMFWLQPRRMIWVLVYGEDGNNGQWHVYEDTWLEGMMDSDPEIIPPEGLYQPEFGFGKLWRDNETVRDMVGWAIDTEYGHVTTYQYFAGGEVTPNGEYITGPGYHTLVSRYGGTYMFDEATWTWRRAPGT